ncbi:hypothetical protein [Vallitalea okinawensis]|uniref:hypothetical protein n=1 Tax=Vallitalea okinawensis TaxID=2078660 RepID=UPI000CFD99DC|nr:hypothetical protein [Vallitalea okinawensis]
MFGDGIPFTERAKFLLNNVRDLPNDLITACDNETVIGLADLRDLLLEIYRDVDTYIVSDHLESYHNITYTANLFLYAISLTGEIKKKDDEYYLSVPKDVFKKVYKKSVFFPLVALEHYGIYFEYFKEDKIVNNYKRCNWFDIHFKDSNNLALALNFLSNSFDSVDNKTEYGDAISMLAKADYSRLVMKISANRERVSPMRSDIVNSVLNKSVYIRFVTRLLDIGLSTSIYYQRYCCPFWNISFLKDKKKLICRVQIFSNCIRLFFPIPQNTLENLVINRKKYPQSIMSAIEKFGCVSCGKCKRKGESYLKVIDGVNCCYGHADARTIYLSLENEEEVHAILEIIGEFT